MKTIIQLLSIASRLLNVLHGGKANETFSERTERCQDNWYFNAWRKLINAAFRLFGQENHTLDVTTSELNAWVATLRKKGYVVRKTRLNKISC